MPTYLKTPDSVIDYSIDWAAGYLDSQTITTSSWSVVPKEAGGIAILAQAQTTTRATATLNGGVAGHLYQIANHVVLSDGRTDTRSIAIRVEPR